MKQCNTTCPYCGVGCGVTAEVSDSSVISIAGDKSHPANAGRLCVKGTTLAETLTPDGRLLQPRLHGETVSWNQALNSVAGRLLATREQYGPESIAFYLSGQLLTEDYYVANKLMKGFLGSANVDTNSRLCMSAAVAAYQRAFGADYVPCTYQDLEACDLLVMVGSNAAWTHPVVYQRIVESRKANPDKRIVLIDPRRTASSDAADLYLQIAPGSDAYLFGGLLNYLESAGKLDKHYIAAHTQGFEAALAMAASISQAEVADKTGLAPQLLEQFFRLFGATEKVVTLYSQGINQSATGTDNCNSIINCHLATGRLGRSGMGPFSITGQPNAMGGREVGGLANQLAAHMDFGEQNIRTVETFWKAPDMARKPGLKAVDMFRAVASGEIRFLWIMATNPAVSLPDTALVHRALKKCDFVVVSDCVGDTDTAAYAEALLPAMGWGEKSGTVTNSERCISRQRALVPASGASRPDWWIVSQVAQRMGFDDAFDYQHPAEIFAEHAQLSGFSNAGSRDFDISGLASLTAEEYEALEPTYWPCPSQERTPQPIVEGRFFNPNGRARFIAVEPALPVFKGDAPGLLTLNTGRLRDQWHTMTRTGRVPRLLRHRDFFSVSLSAHDASFRGLVEHDLVEVRSADASVTALVRIEEGLKSGQVFSPIHWSDQYSGNACINGLIPSVTDPVSGQPQLKYSRVSLAPVPARGWGFLLTRQIPLLPELAYWSRVVIPGGYLTLFAVGTSVRVDDCSRLLLEGLRPGMSQTASYQDAGHSDFREVGLVEGELVYACYLNTDRQRLPNQEWVSAQLTADHGEDIMPLLAGLMPGVPSEGRLVCTCWEVGERAIEKAVAAGTCSVERLGEQLRCGTQCGSCIPELRRMLLAGSGS